MSRMRRALLIGLGTICVLSIVLYSALQLWLAERSRPQARGPYLQSVTPDSVWVVWDTKESTTGLVEYGLTHELGQRVGENVAGLHHEVQLTGLLPYTEYYYRIEKGKGGKFRTAANSDHTNFRFVVFGDKSWRKSTVSMRPSQRVGLPYEASCFWSYKMPRKQRATEGRNLRPKQRT